MKNNIFKFSELTKRPYNYFDLSHTLKTSFKLGQLIPTLVMEALPGDRFNFSIESLTRFMPLVSPVMEKFTITHHLFFVPNRIMFRYWEGTITNSDPYELPYCKALSALAVGDVGDYMGLPIGIHTDVEVSAFPGYAYQCIYDEFYRDQRLITEEANPSLSTGGMIAGRQVNVETTLLSAPFIRAWSHDYFTSCLPNAQQGATPVVIPVTASGDDPSIEYDATNYVRLINTNTALGYVGSPTSLDVDSTSYLEAAGQNVVIDPNGSLYANISGDAGTIADLRRAIKLQEYLERMQRGGQRYVEYLQVMFGLSPRDMRLDRPEYIGGSKGNVVISEVLSSAETITYSSNDLTTGSVNNPVGGFAGHGISITGGNKFNYFVEEHGWIMCITSVTLDASYYQGIHKQWQREDYLDFYVHEFALIGEQAITTGELFAEGRTPAQNATTFGYIPRYSEYKFLNNRISGLMRTDLNYWHLAQDYASVPSLNQSFIECVPDTRIFADETGDHIVAHIVFNIGAYRQMPKFSNPTI